jgi:dienelactone hydrolase
MEGHTKPRIWRLAHSGDRVCRVNPVIRLGIALLMAMQAVAQGAEPVLAPGAETAVDLPAGGGRMQVFLPSDYVPTRAWPAVFFYHGQSGQPTTTPLRRFTGDREFIVVGMPYVESVPRLRTKAEHEDYCRREIENLRRARDWLGRHAHVDPQRVYLGGISMGGWATALLGERELPHLAGLVILLAGRANTATPPPASFDGKPVYIGAGETDANLHAARRASALYRHFGARVTFEEYPGTGHAVPAEAPALTAWLDAQGRLRSVDGEAARAEVAAWAAVRLDLATAENDSVKRYWALRELWEDPRFPYAGPAGEALVRQALPPLLADPRVRAERSAQEALHRLLVTDAQSRRIEDLEAVRDGLRRLSDESPDTRAGRIAAQEFAWVDAAYSKAVAAAKTAAAPPPTSPATNAPVRPSMSTGSRGGFPIPEYDHGKIRFKR